jgi:hypothetical protein
MRNFGAVLLLLGVAGFLFASSKLSGLDPVPPGMSVEESLSLAAGRWELARFASAAAAGIGLVFAIFVRGR